MDDGRKVSLILMRPDPASFGPKPSPMAGGVTLYRHKRSWLFKFLYLLGMATHAGGAEEFQRQFLKNRRLANEGVFNRWFRGLFRRYSWHSIYRDEREKSFREPPQFNLLWTESGKSVAVLLNGEPWAFVYEKSDKGYSKGVLKPGYKNVWDQGLFEKVFKDQFS